MVTTQMRYENPNFASFAHVEPHCRRAIETDMFIVPEPNDSLKSTDTYLEGFQQTIDLLGSPFYNLKKEHHFDDGLKQLLGHGHNMALEVFQYFANNDDADVHVLTVEHRLRERGSFSVNFYAFNRFTLSLANDMQDMSPALGVKILPK